MRELAEQISGWTRPRTTAAHPAEKKDQPAKELVARAYPSVLEPARQATVTVNCTA